MEQIDFIVIGGGPAGLSAAIAVSRAGGRVVVVDENPLAGGKLLGQRYQLPNQKRWDGVAIAQTLRESYRAAGGELLENQAVWAVESLQRGETDEALWQISLSGGGRLTAPYLLVATGAAERAMPLPGWSKPGVMSIGAAQFLLNYQRVKPGRRVAIVGIDPLSLAVAKELHDHGVEVVGLYLAPGSPFAHGYDDPEEVMRELARLSDLAPQRLLRLVGRCLAHPSIGRWASRCFPKRGVKLPNYPPIHLKSTVEAIVGEQKVEGITLQPLDGAGKPLKNLKKGKAAGELIAVDAVAISGGLYPLAEIPRALGCAFQSIEALGGDLPLHSPILESSRNNLFLAGNIIGIESAPIAMAQGDLVGEVVKQRLTGKHEEGAIVNAQQAIEEARRRAPLHFLPQIEAGRVAQAAAWSAYQDRCKSDRRRR